ncbi:MAG: hypothetical protein M1569_01215 [Candidatus Marsarchaeota archaeon]|nr:hypothetical protein [Candidatus Marsarchaeota archaeon]MCL5413008.1 hypothetical protein [Candidatus Marsarchaeota archaeon]
MSVLNESWNLYRDKISLALIFSIPFIIAFAIPLIAPLPTYMSAGAIFLRSASIFVNGNIDPLSLAVITLSTIFSLLFLSFAFVLISLLVKSRRTHSSTKAMAFRNIESYIGKVFSIFLLYALILTFVNIIGYSLGASALLTAIVGFFLFAIIFYAPSAVVVDDKRVWRAIKDSARLVVREPQYFILWLVLITVVVSVLDVACIWIFGTFLSRYVVLVLNSLFVVPFFVIFMAEAYMSRFKLLKH